jgi:hypothetical protein
MRTSGSGTETRLMVAVTLIALGMVMVLAGGPSQFLSNCEHALRGVATTLHDAWLKAAR